jgi:hypothetical protein
VIVTILRRIAMFLCIVGILVLTGLWIMADEKAKNTPPPAVVKGDLKFSLLSEADSKKVLTMLKQEGFTPQISKEKGTRDEQRGFCVAASFNANIADTIKEMLESGHYKVKVKNQDVAAGKCRIQVEGTFTRKAQAESLAKQIAKELDIVLKVEPVYVQVPADISILVIKDVTDDAADRLRGRYRDKFKEKDSLKDIRFIPYPEPSPEKK